MNRLQLKALAYIIVILACLASCSPKIAKFDPYAYKNATHLKVRTLYIMDLSAEPYEDHKPRVSALEIDLYSALEYAKNLPENDLSARQWEILLDPKGALWGKFSSKWKKEGKVSPYFAGEFKKQIAAGFDSIICLEINKKEPTKCK